MSLLQKVETFVERMETCTTQEFETKLSLEMEKWVAYHIDSEPSKLPTKVLPQPKRTLLVTFEVE